MWWWGSWCGGVPGYDGGPGAFEEPGYVGVDIPGTDEDA